MRAILRLLPLLLGLHLNAADRPGKPVQLGGASSLRSGTVLREKREVRVEAGRTKQDVGGKDVTNVTTRFVQRLNFVRRILGGDSEEVQVREFSQDSGHFMGAAPPAPNETPTTLPGKTLRLRKKTGRWEYSLAQTTPSMEDQKIINELSFAANLLDLPAACVGSGSRKIGESWKTEIPAPRGKAYGFIVADTLESTLVSVDENEGGPFATISVTGKFRMERPMNFNARMEVTFTATLIRRLSDMLDVDTRITGQFNAVAAAITDKRVPITLTYDYPFTIARTLSVEGK